jgi:diaminopimelate epimerase
VEIPFVKMEGCGNDYIYLDLLSGRGVAAASLPDAKSLACGMSDRHFGIGADGLILIHPSRRADARMQMFNADGSEGEMCGNGIRCMAKYLYEEGICRTNPIRIETAAGVLELEMAITSHRVDSVRVDMGIPRLERSEIPMVGPPGHVLDELLDVDGQALQVTALSMGNPHCVVFVQDVEKVPVEVLGPRIESHPSFPRRTNVEFVQVLGPGEVRQRTWERGSGETMACGTGASAVCVAGVVTNRTQRTVLNHLKGGDLTLEWAPDGHLFMEGPAREVFRGTWPVGR